MSKIPMFTFPVRVWLMVLTLALAGCGAGGGGSSSGSSGVTQDSPASVVAASTTSAAPGGIAILRVNVEGSNAASMSYRWSQTGGPPVVLDDGDRALAHFVMPPLPTDTELDFEVRATDRDGKVWHEKFKVRSRHSRHGRHIFECKTTPQFAVFLADKEIDNRPELYFASLDGKRVFRLNDTLAPDGQVMSNFSISPDQRFVAYMADQDTHGVFELYVARTDGGGWC